MFPAIAAQFLSYESFGLKDELKTIAVVRRSASALEDSRKTAPFPGCSLQLGSQSDNQARYTYLQNRYIWNIVN
jgi:hypothetical protein